ncbi:MAG: hypothetical protein U5K69_10060 [Balneolaceae bacterium]|nr:hypothetical protein [Balneolaceae bacterium]
MSIRKGWIITLCSTLLVVVYACQDQPLEPVTSGQEQVTSPELIESRAHSSVAHGQRNFRTHLKGSNEVPAVETNAQGQAILN